MPYVYAGLGATSHQTQKKIALFSKNIEAKFNEINQHTFTHHLGFGLYFLITEHFWLSLSYQLQHMEELSFKYKPVGSSEEGMQRLKSIDSDIKRNGITLDKIFKPFHFNDLNTQTIQLTARYVFG